MNFIQKVWDWVVWSSANSDEVSTSVKGFLTFVITIVSVGAGVGHIQLPGELLTQVVDATIGAVQAIIAALSAVMFLAGIIRKLWRTVRGTNVAIQP